MDKTLLCPWLSWRHLGCTADPICPMGQKGKVGENGTGWLHQEAVSSLDLDGLSSQHLCSGSERWQVMPVGSFSGGAEGFGITFRIRGCCNRPTVLILLCPLPCLPAPLPWPVCPHNSCCNQDAAFQPPPAGSVLSRLPRFHFGAEISTSGEQCHQSRQDVPGSDRQGESCPLR